MKHFHIAILVLLCTATVLFSQITWTSRTTGSHYDNAHISFGNNIFVVQDNGYLYSSTDGITWTNRTPSGLSTAFTCVGFCNNIFIASAPQGVILTSSDGITWTTRTSSTLGWLYRGVTFGNNKYVLAGQIMTSLDLITMGSIFTSPDAITWTNRLSDTVENLQAVTFGNGIYIAVGEYGTILTSLDAITWTKRTSGTGASFSGITYGNNQYIAVGSGGTILTSPNGITWSSRNSGTTRDLLGITYGNNQFVAVGSNGTIVTSFDGIAWTSRISGLSIHILYDVTNGNGLFVAAGSSGTILTSPATTPITYTAPKHSSSITGKTMQIYTLQGKLIAQHTISGQNYLDGKSALYSGLSKGIYIVKIPCDNAIVSRRVLVE